MRENRRLAIDAKRLWSDNQESSDLTVHNPVLAKLDRDCAKFWKKRYKAHCIDLRKSIACYLKAKKVDRDGLEWGSIDGRPEGGDYRCKTTKNPYEPTREKISHYDKDNNISLPDRDINPIIPIPANNNNNSNLVQDNIITIIFNSVYYLLPLVTVFFLPLDIYYNQLLIDYLAELSYDMLYIDFPLESSNVILQLDCSSVTTDQLQVDYSLKSTDDKLYINYSSISSNKMLDVDSTELSNEILSVNCSPESSDKVTNEFIFNY